MASAEITRRDLSLGSQDSVTGWYAKSFSETTIDGSIQPRGAAIMGLPCGGTARYPQTLFTADVIHIGDEVKDQNNDVYEVKTADQYWWLNQFSHYQCSLEKRSPYALRPTTSGTWHLDTDSLKTDPRYRHKLWLDTYLTAGNLLLDDGVSLATYRTCFSGADYPLTQVFITKDVDALFSIGEEETDSLYDVFDSPYAEVVSVPITCCAIDKAGLTATNLVEQMKEEVKHVATDHALGSKRSISSTKPKYTDIGGTKLWETTVTIRYKRYNDDYVPTYPRITWGPSAAPTGTFYFPNCVDIQYSGMTTDAKSHPPSFVGDIKQPQGAGPLRIKIISDLDLDNTTYTWMRPQTATPKTDNMNWQVFADIDHNGGIDEPYQTLTLDWGSMKVRQLSYDTYKRNETLMSAVVYEEYTNTDQSGNTLATRWTIT